MYIMYQSVEFCRCCFNK